MFRPPPSETVDYVKRLWNTGGSYTKKQLDSRYGSGFNSGAGPARTTSRAPARGGSGGGRGGGRSRVPRLSYPRRSRRHRRAVRRLVRGSRRRKSRISRLKPISHSKKGVTSVFEASGTTSNADSNAEAVYIGHCDMPAQLTFRQAIGAILKSFLARFGCYYRTQDDIMQFGGVISFNYYTSPTATSISTTGLTFISTSTFNQVSTGLRNLIVPIIEADPALKPYAFVIAPSDATGGLPRTFYCDSITLTYTAQSRLKIQNRTPNEGGTDAIDTNDVNFLVGNVYRGTGSGTYLKGEHEGSPYQPFIGDKQYGQILVSRNDNMSDQSVWLRHPPETTKFFTRVKSMSTVSKFAPGATKYSMLKTTRKISFISLIDNFLKEMNTQSYLLSTLGKFAFFGFQKFIDDDQSVKVNIAYETELQIGCTCSMKTNIHMAPIYQERA